MSEVLTPTVTILTMTNADQEYSFALPAGCKHFAFQCRSANDVRIAFVTGKVATSVEPFVTMKSGGSISSPEKLMANPGTTIYAACAAAGKILEFITWA